MTDFTVDVSTEEPTPVAPPPEPTPVAPPPADPAPPPPAPEPEKVDAGDVEVKTPPKKKPVKKPIRKSDKVVEKKVPETIVSKPKTVVPAPTPPVRPAQPVSRGPKLTPEEIAKMLAAGAKPSDRTSVPDSDDGRCATLIRDQIYAAWRRPNADAITGRDPEVTLSIGPGGVVRSVTLRESSGNAELDASVLAAARAVGRFRNLSERFVRANPSVTFTFILSETR